MFSFNNPSGMCPDCGGLGAKMIVDEGRLVPDARQVPPRGRGGAPRRHRREPLALPPVRGGGQPPGFTLDTAWGELTGDQKEASSTVSGTAGSGSSTTAAGATPGPMTTATRRLKFIEERLHHGNARVRSDLGRYVRTGLCHLPRGPAAGRGPGGAARRQRPARDHGPAHRGQPPVLPQPGALRREGPSSPRTPSARSAAVSTCSTISASAISPWTAAPTPCRGESQRIRLASQIGSGLVGVLYILDEPSIGLHARDNRSSSTPSSGCATWATP